MPEYRDACATARTEARSELCRLLPERTITSDHVELLTEVFMQIIHAMPPWALRAIADRKEASP